MAAFFDAALGTRLTPFVQGGKATFPAGSLSVLLNVLWVAVTRAQDWLPQALPCIVEPGLEAPHHTCFPALLLSLEILNNI